MTALAAILCLAAPAAVEQREPGVKFSLVDGPEQQAWAQSFTIWATVNHWGLDHAPQSFQDDVAAWNRRAPQEPAYLRDVPTEDQG
jgi:hypothetical protein